MDTIVLPDPLSSLLTLRAGIPSKELFRLVIKHALNALGYRELALAEVSPPIVVIAPEHFGRRSAYSTAVAIAGDTDTLIHAGRIFGHNFESAKELIDFINRSGDALQIVQRMADPSGTSFRESSP